MRQMSKKIKEKIINNQILYFVLFALAIYVLQKLTFSWGADDVVNSYEHRYNYLSIIGEFKHIFEQGGNWTSRIIVYLVGRLAAQLFSRTTYEIWFVLNSVIFTILAYNIAAIGETEDKKYTKLIAIFSMFFVPFLYFKSAGWYVTMVVYMWPIAAAVVCLRYVMQISTGLKKSIGSKLLIGLLLIYAANLETVAIFMTLVLFGIIILEIIKEKRVKISLVIYELICVAELLFHMISPGQQARYNQEIGYWFVDYETLSFLDKLELGISSTFDLFLFQPNMIFLIFTFLLCYIVWTKYDSTNKRVVASIPFLTTLLLGTLKNITSILFPNIISNINASNTRGVVTVQTCYNFEKYMPIIIIAVVCISIVLSLIMAFDDFNKIMLTEFIFLGGAASRIAMGFSPTVWASGRRTYIMMFYSFSILLILLIGEIMSESDEKKKKVILSFMGVLGTISYIEAMFIPNW